MKVTLLNLESNRCKAFCYIMQGTQRGMLSGSLLFSVRAKIYTERKQNNNKKQTNKKTLALNT